ncbi:sensor histidine kinase [Terrihabitans rhizophilus]|uniref:histidine kinase n=1 Tax=Terrihabitans rhizophilus TaxID=3092662 RepID=A0ABU4RMT3_9HYPH|nr:DUF4118 domain-containing protein [Terrihabitans sp. PJ23]MDX6806142.1 DUF4118 domain-containing protein [Terrihabitans sp. PJ23]
MTRPKLSLRERVPIWRDRPLAAYCFAVVISVAACVLRAVLDPYFPPGFPYLTFFPAVIISSFLMGIGPGILAAVLCGLMAWYFFMPPFDSFAVEAPTAVALAFYVGVVAVDIALIHWMQLAMRHLREERQRSADLAERSTKLAARNELLFQELQHRVANNLQMVGAILSLQKRGVADGAARKALEDASAKLRMIGQIQRQLYDLHGSRTNLDAFLGTLVRDVMASADQPGITYSVRAETAAQLDADAVTPLALIVAEAISNALEHGFSERTGGHIEVVAERRGTELHLQVADNGAGLPEHADFSLPGSLGLKIATAMAAQLSGRFTLAAGDAGAVSSLVMPLPNDPV